MLTLIREETFTDESLIGEGGLDRKCGWVLDKVRRVLGGPMTKKLYKSEFSHTLNICHSYKKKN